MDELKEIIKGCIDGNHRCREALYKHLSSKLFGVCLRFAGRREDAEDMLQESMIRIFENIKKFRGDGHFDAWARRISVNVCLEQIRKKNPLTNHADIYHTGMEDHTEDIISGISVSEMFALLNSMPVGYRTIFNLYEIEEYSHAEIAEKLGISEGTSKSQLARAKALLRDKFASLNKIAVTSKN